MLLGAYKSRPKPVSATFSARISTDGSCQHAHTPAVVCSMQPVLLGLLQTSEVEQKPNPTRQLWTLHCVLGLGYHICGNLIRNFIGT